MEHRQKAFRPLFTLKNWLNYLILERSFFLKNFKSSLTSTGILIVRVPLHCYPQFSLKWTMMLLLLIMSVHFSHKIYRDWEVFTCSGEVIPMEIKPSFSPIFLLFSLPLKENGRLKTIKTSVRSFKFQEISL